MEFEEENFRKFKKFCEKTEVIREHQKILFTFWDMKLPYIFVAEHQLGDRVAVRKGIILVEKPHIIRPHYYRGFEFSEGFKYIPPKATYLLREMGFPHSRVTNKPVAKEEIEYGSLQEILQRYNKKLEREEDTETGLIKGVVEGIEASLVRYSIGLAIKSAPENVKQFFEHLKLQRKEPIRVDEKITDEEIRRLFV